MIHGKKILLPSEQGAMFPKIDSLENFLIYNVEPAVNRQPGFRRGAVEQSALNNIHNFKKLARSPDTRRAGAGDVRGR